MKIRKATEQDLLVVSSWLSNVSAVITWGGAAMHFPLTLEQLKIDIAWQKANSHAFVNQSNELIGFAQSMNKFGYIHLGRIVLSPACRGKKLAGKLMALLLDSANESGIDFSLFVYDHNMPAQKLYRRLGFEPRDYPAACQYNAECTFMVKNISEAHV